MKQWNNIQRPVILASQSPRRQEILTTMGITFDVMPPKGVDEPSFFKGNLLEEALQSVAHAKALAVAQYNKDSLVIGSDTIVTLGGQIMGKPTSYEDALSTLQKLSGKTHSVWSGVAFVVYGKIALQAVAQTEVTFRQLERQEIESYLNLRTYQDKAGAYGIQDEAMLFVEKINGCYNNIVGFPVATTIELFRKYHSLKGDNLE